MVTGDWLPLPRTTFIEDSSNILPGQDVWPGATLVLNTVLLQVLAYPGSSLLTCSPPSVQTWLSLQLSLCLEFYGSDACPVLAICPLPQHTSGSPECARQP